MMLKLMLELEFTTSPVRWVGGGGCVWDYARLMLSQLQLKLELKLKLSLATIKSLVRFEKFKGLNWSKYNFLLIYVIFRFNR